jgi:hypothetical protein
MLPREKEGVVDER